MFALISFLYYTISNITIITFYSTDTSEAGIIILAVLTGILGSVVIGLVTLLIITWKRVPEGK